MRIIDTLSKDLILSDLQATHKNSVISEFAMAIAKAYPELTVKEIEQILLEREKLGSTGIQDGIAIPHGKIDKLSKIIVSFGRSKEGIDFEAHDNQKTHLFFVLLAPESATGLHLKILAKLSRLLKSATLREKLLKADNAEELYQTLLDADARLQESGVIQD